MKHVSFYLYLVLLIAFRNTNLHKHPQFNDLLWFQQSLNKRLLSTYTLAVCSNTLHFVRSFDQISMRGKEMVVSKFVACFEIAFTVEADSEVGRWKYISPFDLWMNAEDRVLPFIRVTTHDQVALPVSCTWQYRYRTVKVTLELSNFR